MSNQVKSGVSVILNLTSRIRIPKSADYVDNLYLKLCNIRRGDKESFFRRLYYKSDKIQTNLEYMSRTKGNRTITIPQTDQEEDDDMYSFEDDTNLELETNSNTDVTEYFNFS